MEKARDNPIMEFGKNQEQKGGYSSSAKKNKKVHFASLKDICHLKNAELEPNIAEVQSRVVLRGDIVKDDSGAYAVFTEQGSSASQMTAPKIMGVIVRLPGCDGQAADAVSAYTQVKLKDAPRLSKITKSECPDIWIRLPRHKCQNHGEKLKILWYLLNDTCMAFHYLDCHGKDNSKKLY